MMHLDVILLGMGRCSEPTHGIVPVQW